MNKEEIISILNAFQANLCFDNWLIKIGNFPEESSEQSYLFHCKKVATGEIK